MPARNSSTVISAALIGAGLAAWALAGRPLTINPDLTTPPNPLGIKRSPYGEVFAIALQDPINTDFHAGAFGRAEHHHEDGKECQACSREKAEAQAAKLLASEPTRALGLQEWLTSLDRISQARTNPKPASEALRFYFRREAEDKLRFAYQLDPANYSNYNSLHFFLTEPSIGTRPELTPTAAKLAEETIQYCLKKADDPRPALTAAAAATNVLELMFNDQRNPQPKFTLAQMRQYLDLLDFCLARYATLTRQWQATKQWDFISTQRIDECNERFTFVSKIREAAAGTIVRLEQTHPAQAAN